VGALRIIVSARLELERMAAAAYPDEGCGVMVGGFAGPDVTVVRVIPGRNLVTDRARDRYELDPGDILAAEREARRQGLDVVGFWHSHPDHPARPSRFDTERAWPEYAYAICSTTAEGTVDVRAWRLGEAGGEFEELELARSGTAA
jgi:proteasome lid subunit RPN8/RPN11